MKSLARVLLLTAVVVSYSTVAALAQVGDGGATYKLDPNAVWHCEDLLETDLPSPFVGAVVNTYLGANRFYAAGITGQNSITANVEAGHIWDGPSGHQTLTHVPLANNYTPIGALGDISGHATFVGMILGGRGSADYKTGIAYNTDLRSGAIATGFASGGGFDASATTFLDAYNHYFGTADVINSSWSYPDSPGYDGWTIALDGFIRAHPQTTFVVAAGNEGPTTNTVGGPASGWNGIAVGALANNGSNGYNSIASFSSRGPQDYWDPTHGTVANVRASVDIVAPGDHLLSAYYGGATAENTGGVANGTPSSYTIGAGTSFAAPIVASGVALLESASHTTNMPALSRDTRVIRAVVLNSADKNLTGWNNGQSLVSGVVTTTQSLDWTLGAGRLNLNTAYDQYLSGLKDAAGVGGSTTTIPTLGWDYGELTVTGGHNDYVFNTALKGGSTLDVTLSWLRDREVNVEELWVDDLGFANLDLQVWDSTFTNLIATSKSLYNSVEELHFALPSDGAYGLRVLFYSQMFGTAGTEGYGLAWSGVTVPEPAGIALLIAAALAGLAIGARKAKSRKGSA